MEEIRKLSTILFADIVGYSALMQQDERKALGTLNAFKKILEEEVEQQQGRIIQFFGDGCLLSFESATHGVTCASALQKRFIQQEVPVRIGMHLGEVLYKNNNAFGDGVNIASRIESMGVPGAIIVSKAIRDQIKNNADFQLAPLGAYPFKNIEAPMQIFAIANEGFTVPKAHEMKGKLKEKQGGLFEQLWKKRILQVLGLYVLLAWLGVQLLDWALAKFSISPYWSQIFFITVLGLIPSLVVYLNSRERLRRGQIHLGEKILFPSNLILIGGLLFFMFRSADLGATTKFITLTEEDGSVVTETVIKEEFRKFLQIYPFEPIKKDSLHEWVGHVLDYPGNKISENKYLQPNFVQLPANRIHIPFTKAEKIQNNRYAKTDIYVDGQYQVIGDQYEMIPAVHNSKTGKLIKESRYIGSDLFEVIDSVEHFIIQSVGLSTSQIEATPDLSLHEICTDNIEAYKHAVIASSGLGSYFLNVEKAIELDTTFAMAAADLASRLDRYNGGELEAKHWINLAMRHRNRLPFNNQIWVRATKHLIDQEWEQA